MVGRLIFEVFVFSIPFLVFGLYLLVTKSAEERGQRKWPIQMLFLIGIALATIAWFVMIFLEDKSPNICREPARFENGVVIPERTYPCEHRIEDVGLPNRPRDQAPPDASD